MKSPKVLAIALGCIAELASGELHAQARGPALDEWKGAARTRDPAVMRIEMEAWLRPLVGNFRIEGIAQLPISQAPQSVFQAPRPVRGFGDCASVGAGPGVYCVFDAMWKGQRSASMSLYGMDPATLEIRSLSVDHRGRPQCRDATLQSGGVVRFVEPCVDSLLKCRGIVSIKGDADGAPIEIKSELWVDYFADLEPISTFRYTLRKLPRHVDRM